MVLWARKGTGITSAANAVSNWADQSGLGHNLPQATGASQPTLQSDGTILFNGSSHFLKAATFALIQPFSLYLRAKPITWILNRGWTDGDAFNTGPQIFDTTATPTIGLFSGAVGPTGNGAALNQWSSIAGIVNGAASVLNINGAESTGNSGASNANGFTLGALGNGTGPANIQVAEVILYNVAHDAATRASIIAYLNTI